MLNTFNLFLIYKNLLCSKLVKYLVISCRWFRKSDKGDGAKDQASSKL